jgi:cysteinyl-tRNA synthetase
MELRLYDTLTREKRPFRPLDPARVRMYVCGPTVYDFAHIGNARPVIVFDVLFRLLRHLYGADHVIYVRNITDVDDKINARAAEEYPDLPLNEAIRLVTEKTEKQFHEDVDALGCLPPTVEPRATEHIAEMKVLIERLIAAGHAYVAEDHVLFSVPSMPDYGKLAKRSLDEMEAGARVEVAPYKKDPMDFVLWKPSKPGEPSWPSPAGIAAPGRPGWHIECSAMSWKHLGETFDIHGGGIDLVFPHHENEIAQSRCAFHTPVMAQVWMHNGFLQVEGKKMAKSEGNFVTIREALSHYDGNGLAIRYNMLRGHYRQPFDWTENGMNQAINELNDLWLVAGDYDPGGIDDHFITALCDDLNTALARSRIFELKAAARTGDVSAGQRLRGTLEWYGFSELFVSDEITMPIPLPDDAASQLVSVINHQAGSVTMQAIADGLQKSSAFAGNSLVPLFWSMLRAIDPKSRVRDIRHIEAAQHKKIFEAINFRLIARKSKNFIESDRIRDDLAKMGVTLKDTKENTTWELKR